jgi:hypothetical protein
MAGRTEAVTEPGSNDSITPAWRLSAWKNFLDELGVVLLFAADLGVKRGWHFSPGNKKPSPERVTNQMSGFLKDLKIAGSFLPYFSTISVSFSSL